MADIAQHSLGKMLDKAKNKGEPRPYLRNLNVRWFDFDLSDVLEMRILPSEVERYSVRKGDVLVCEGGYPGRAAIWDRDEPIFFQKALHRVRFRDPGVAKWFVYYLHSKDLDGTLFEHFNGAGIQHFTGEALARFEVPLPPRDDREHIVSILDEAFEGIATARANAERNLRNARALFESHLAIRVASCFESWPTKTLGEVCDTSAGGTPLTSRRDYYDGGAVPWITSGEVGQGDVHTATRFITDKGLSSSSAKLFPRSTVLVAMYGATAGQVGLLRIEAATNQAVCGVLPSERFVPEFLYYLLIAKREELVAQAAGNAQPNISQAKIRGTLIPLVPLDEQQRVVAVIDALVSRVRELEAIYRRKLAALDELKRSLLHHAFTGQLTERTAAALGA